MTPTVQYERVTWLRGSSEAQRLQCILQLFDLSPQSLPFIWQSSHIHHGQSGLDRRRNGVREQTEIKNGDIEKITEP